MNATKPYRRIYFTILIVVLLQNFVFTTSQSLVQKTNIQFNVSENVPIGTSVGNFLSNAELFQSPYIVVPIEPKLMDDLTQTIDIDLRNGEIKTKKPLDLLQQPFFKFTVVSIFQGSSRIVEINIINSHENNKNTIEIRLNLNELNIGTRINLLDSMNSTFNSLTKFDILPINNDTSFTEFFKIEKIEDVISKPVLVLTQKNNLEKKRFFKFLLRAKNETSDKIVYFNIQLFLTRIESVKNSNSTLLVNLCINDDSDYNIFNLNEHFKRQNINFQKFISITKNHSQNFTLNSQNGELIIEKLLSNDDILEPIYLQAIDYQHTSYDLIINLTTNISRCQEENTDIKIFTAAQSEFKFEKSSYYFIMQPNLSTTASFGSVKLDSTHTKTSINEIRYSLNFTKNSDCHMCDADSENYFHVNASNGEIYLKKSLNESLRSSFMFTIQANINASTISASVLVVLSTEKVENFNNFAETIAILDENTEIGSLIFNVKTSYSHPNATYHFIQKTDSLILLENTDAFKFFSLNKFSGDVKLTTKIKSNNSKQQNLQIISTFCNSIECKYTEIPVSIIIVNQENLEKIMEKSQFTITTNVSINTAPSMLKPICRISDFILSKISYVETLVQNSNFYIDSSNGNVYLTDYRNRSLTESKETLLLQVYNVTLSELNNLSLGYFSFTRLRVNLTVQFVEESTENNLKFAETISTIEIQDDIPINKSIAELTVLNKQYLNYENLQFDAFKSCSNNSAIELFDKYFSIVKSTGRLMAVKSLKTIESLDFCAQISLNYINWDSERFSDFTIIKISVLELNKEKPVIETDANLIVNIGSVMQNGTSIADLAANKIIAKIKVTDRDKSERNNRIKNFVLSDRKNLLRFSDFFEFNSSNGLIKILPNIQKEKLVLLKNLSTFEFNIRVFDNGEPSLSSNKDFTMKLIFSQPKSSSQMNEFQLAQFSRRVFYAQINENAKIATEIEFDAQINENVFIENFASSKYRLNFEDPTETFGLENIDTKSGWPTIVNKKLLDRETIGNYTVFMHVTDENDRNVLDNCVIIIRVLDINDNYPIVYYNNTSNATNTTISISIPENYEKIYEFPIIASDVDMDDNALLSYTLIDEENYNGIFQLNSDSGLFTIRKPLDYEQKSSYKLTIQINDNGSPSLSSFVQIFIYVINLNDNAPSITSIDTIYIDIFANFSQSFDTEIALAKIKAKDLDDASSDGIFQFNLNSYQILLDKTLSGNLIYLIFRIEPSTGLLLCKLWPVSSASLLLKEKFSENQQSTLIVYATDTGLPKPLQSSKTISLNINFTLNSLTIDFYRRIFEPLSVKQPLVYQDVYTVNIFEGFEKGTGILTIQLYEAALPSAWTSWFKIVGGNIDNAFTIDVNKPSAQPFNEITIKTNKVLDRETRDTYKLKVATFFQSNVSTTSGKNFIHSYVYVIVNVIDINDNPPVFIQNESDQKFVNESIQVGSIIKTLRTYDADAFSVIEYAFAKENGNPDNMFYIDALSGVVFLQAPLDYEKASKYEIKVVVSDGFYSTQKVIHLDVVDCDDNLPAFSQNELFSSVSLTDSSLLPGIKLNAFDADKTLKFNETLYLFYSRENKRFQNLNSDLFSAISADNIPTGFNFTFFVIKAENVNSNSALTNANSFKILYLLRHPLRYFNKAEEQLYEIESYSFDVYENAQLGSIIGFFSIKSSNETLYLAKESVLLPFELSQKCFQSSNGDKCDVLLADNLNKTVKESYLLNLSFLNEKSSIKKSVEIQINVFNLNDLSLWLDGSENYNSSIRVDLNYTNYKRDLVIAHLNARSAEFASKLTCEIIQGNGQSVFHMNNKEIILNKDKLNIFLRKTHLSEPKSAIELLEKASEANFELTYNLAISVNSYLQPNFVSILEKNVVISIDRQYVKLLIEEVFGSFEKLLLNQIKIEHISAPIIIAENTKIDTKLYKFLIFPQSYLKTIGAHIRFQIDGAYNDIYSVDYEGFLVNRVEFDFEQAKLYEISLNDSRVIMERTHEFGVSAFVSIGDAFERKIETNFVTKIADIDEHPPKFSSDYDVFIYANLSVGSMITQLEADDEDSGAAARVYYTISQADSPLLLDYFSIDRFSGCLYLRKSLLTLLHSDFMSSVKIGKSHFIYSNDSLIVSLSISTSTALANSLHDRKALKIIINYSCEGCKAQSGSSNAGDGKRVSSKEAFASSTAFVLLVVFVAVILLLSTLIFVYKFKKCFKSSRNEMTSSVTKFYDSSRNISVISNRSDSLYKDIEGNQSMDDVQNCNQLGLISSFFKPKNSVGKADADPRNEVNFLPYFGTLTSKDFDMNLSNSEKSIANSGIFDKSTKTFIEPKSYNSLHKSQINAVCGNSQIYSSNYHSIEAENQKTIQDIRQLVGEKNLPNVDFKSIQNCINLDCVHMSDQQRFNLYSKMMSVDATSINSVINNNLNDDEFSFLKWDDLLDWTPHFNSFSGLFEDLDGFSEEKDKKNL